MLDDIMESAEQQQRREAYIQATVPILELRTRIYELFVPKRVVVTGKWGPEFIEYDVMTQAADLLHKTDEMLKLAAKTILGKEIDTSDNIIWQADPGHSRKNKKSSVG